MLQYRNEVSSDCDAVLGYVCTGRHYYGLVVVTIKEWSQRSVLSGVAWVLSLDLCTLPLCRVHRRWRAVQSAWSCTPTMMSSEYCHAGRHALHVLRYKNVLLLLDYERTYMLMWLDYVSYKE